MDGFACEYPPSQSQKIDAVENELSTLVGLDDFKSQLTDFCRSLTGKLPHFLFCGNRGTGKTMVGLRMGKLLKMMGLIQCDKVTVLTKTDFDYGPDGKLVAYPETIAKIKEAKGGVLFLDNALPIHIYERDEEDEEEINFVDAKEELLSFMDSGNGVVVFAMRKTTPFHWDEAFDKRVSIVSHFKDFTCEQLAKILLRMMPYMRTGLNKIPNVRFKLDAWCQSVENVAGLLERETTLTQRMGYNAFMLEQMLEIAVDGMYVRICRLLMNDTPLDQDYTTTLTEKDLIYGLRRLNKWIR